MTRRRTFAALALSSVFFAAYGSLVPLRWRDEAGWAGVWERLRTIPLEPLALRWGGDLFVNVLVFLPIGFFTSAAFDRPTRRDGFHAPVFVALLVVGLAVAIECSQVLVRDRTASWSDVVGLSLGGLAGVAIWLVAGPAMTDRLVAAFRSGSGDGRVFVVLGFYTAGWVLVGLLPVLFPPFAYPLVSSMWLRHAAEPTVSTELAETLLTALAVVPLGAFLMLVARRQMWSAWAGSALAAGGAAGVVMVDRLRQVAPLLAPPGPGARVAGVVAGAWLIWRFSNRLSALSASRRGSGALLLLAGWCAVLVLVAWAPFDFGLPADLVDQRVRILYERAPLHRYYWAPPLVALNLALTVLLLAAPAGALLLLGIRAGGRRLSVGLCVVLGTALFAALEWGQVYLPGRRADPSDVVIAALGALIGALLARAVATSPSRLQGGS